MLKTLLLLATLAISISAAAQNRIPQALQGVHRIVMLGDSITQFGDGPKGYVGLVRSYLETLFPQAGIEVINAGISGNKSTDMIARYQKDVLDKKPDLVTISVGVNDVWHGFFDNHPDGNGPRRVPLGQYRDIVSSMLEQALAQGVRVVILSATVIGEDLDGPMNKKAVPYNKALQDIAKSHDVIYVDYQKAFRALISDYRRYTGGRDLLLTVDGVHMNDEGNKVMAHTLLTALGVTPEAQKTYKRS